MFPEKQTDRVIDELKRREVTLVTVDGPDLPDLFPRLDVVTNSEFFYIRFHGRNAKGWRSGNMQKQFNYDYSDRELREWSDRLVPALAKQARKGFFFFNNHVRAQAPDNALKLMDQLADMGMLQHASPRSEKGGISRMKLYKNERRTSNAQHRMKKYESII